MYDAILSGELDRTILKAKGQGVLFENDQVPIAFTTHYEVFLGQPSVTQPLDTLGLFPTKLNDNDALYMVRTVSEAEVKEAMFSMGNEKSPGPDGYTAAFFKDVWDVVGNEVVAAVREFFSNGNLLKELNHTVIVLIPKTKNPTRATDYRPITVAKMSL
ncbi:hypothetical protein Tco_0150718 [Tanacetum coccineum]